MEGYVTTFWSSSLKPRATCSQCRYRKVRCDGGPGACSNCERLSFACSLSQLAPGEQQVESPSGETLLRDRPERRRASKACDGCRGQKIRCSGEVPQCLSCKRRGVQCSYPSATRRKPRGRQASDAEGLRSRTPTAADPSGMCASHRLTSGGGARCDDAGQHPVPGLDGSSDGAAKPDASCDIALPVPTAVSLVDYFCDVVYALPSYAFLYRPGTRQRWIDDTLDVALRFAISGVALSYQEAGKKPGTKEHTVASRWIQRAEQIVWDKLESPTVARLQALMLVILYRINVGQFQRGFMLLGLAARAAAAMRLNHERSDQHSASSEVRRRLVWCLKLVERYFCIGLPEFELCPLENIYLRMPTCERNFAEGSAGVDKDSLGAYPLCIRLERLRRDIMRLARSLTLCEQPVSSLPRLIQDFEMELGEIGKLMDEGPGLTPEKLSHVLHIQWLPRHVLMHLSWHQCHCDLFKILLPGFREAAPKVVLDALEPAFKARAESLCFHHAASIIDALSLLNQQCTEARLLEWDTAICGYHATRLVLFLSRAGKSGTAHTTEELARCRAELCLAALKRFFANSVIARPLLEEMGRAIAMFPSPESEEPEKLPVANPRRERRRDKSPQQQLSAAAQARQRLAIHSLLRQADFSDGDDDDDDWPEETAPSLWGSAGYRLGSSPVVDSPGLEIPQRRQPVRHVQTIQSPESVSPDRSNSQKSPHSPFVTLEWQNRNWLSGGFTNAR